MRGIEAALRAYEGVERGEYASEALRKVLDQVDRKTEQTLATGLLYGALRKQLLWEYLLKKALRVSWKDLPREVRHAFLIGAGGIMTLRNFAPPVLVSALVAWLREKGYERDSRTLNATLRHFPGKAAPLLEELSRKGDLFSLGLLQGLPRWYVHEMEAQHGHARAKEILRLYRIRPYTSFRLRSSSDLGEIAEELATRGLRSWESPLVASSLRTSGTCLVSELASYARGDITPQGESSLGVGAFFPALKEDKPRILDMCAGRGGKTGLLAERYEKASLEAWEVSEGKVRALGKELLRLGCAERVRIRLGDALVLEDSSGFDMILVDAPCSGSGTWQRHPEGKSRILPRDVRALEKLQRKLLKRAGEMLHPGGYILYCTCSLLREENEETLGEALKENPSLVEVPLKEKAPFVYRGKPWGRYAYPETPWGDGFFAALLMKRPENSVL
ncbi:MAG TPA: RsmB/NOP family class I SAM-dependent RNA methyltransferase [Synergistaceae bacterium]|nr:RsmB/NOP family class I SAM-dependent RNA methyltransferase [Synergistaceae bacterium]